MDLIYLVLGLSALACILFYIQKIIPGDATIKSIISVLIFLVVLLFVLKQFKGLIPNVMP